MSHQLFNGDVDNTVDHSGRVGHQIVLCRVVEHFTGCQLEAASVQRAFYLRAGKIAITQAGILMGAHLISDKHARLCIGDNHVAISQRHTTHIVVRNISEVTHSDLFWLVHGWLWQIAYGRFSITHAQCYYLISRVRLHCYTTR